MRWIMSNPVAAAFLQDAIRRLESAGIDNAKLDAALLVSHALKITREALLMQPERPLTAAETTAIETLLARRIKREPLAYITGRREFWSLPFRTAPGVLIPRPDTETMITAAQQLFEKQAPLSILDLGTGSGCILLSLLHQYPNATGTGVDISPQALDIATENARELALANRASFLLSRWAEELSGQFDLIVSNPPYIETAAIQNLEPEISLYEPLQALDGGMDGLDAYRQIAAQIPAHLTPQGKVILEVGFNQAEAVREIITENRLQFITYANDLAGIRRCVIASA